MSDFGRLGRIVRISAGALAALLAPLGVFIAVADLRGNWASALATVAVAAFFVYLAVRADSLPFLDDPAVPEE